MREVCHIFKETSAFADALAKQCNRVGLFELCFEITVNTLLYSIYFVSSMKSSVTVQKNEVFSDCLKNNNMEVCVGVVQCCFTFINTIKKFILLINCTFGLLSIVIVRFRLRLRVLRISNFDPIIFICGNHAILI